MIRKLKSIFLLNSMFSKLMASFILIILTVSSIHLLSYKVYINNISNEIEKNANERLINVVNKFDQNFEQIQKILLKIYNDDTFKLENGNVNLTPYQEKLFIDKLKSFSYDNVYISNIFLISENSDFIVTPYGSYDKKRFFETFYYNPTFSEADWMKEIGKSFSYNYYPARIFYNRSPVSSETPELLMPIAFKNKDKSRFLLVALVDITSLSNSIEVNFMDNLFISKNNGELLYPLKSDIDIKKLQLSSNKDVIKAKTGYVFSHKSTGNGLTYIKLLSNTYITSQLRETYFILFMVVAFAFIVSLIISVYLVRKFNNPVKSLVDIIKKSELITHVESNVDLNQLKVNVEKIISQNSSFIEDINLKNSMLKDFFYQSKLKNIHWNINEMKDQFMLESNYVLIYFKIHYREEFCKTILNELSESSFLIKELIQRYLKSYFKEIVVFQPENDQIITIVNICKDDRSISDAVVELLPKLRQEDEYIFFTIVISETYSDVSELNNVYGKVFEIAKNRNLSQDTQVLYEGSVSLHQEKFYFSLEQAEQLSNTLINGRADEATQQVKKLLEYNFKKQVNGFYIALLSMEIINCCSKVLTELYNEVPEIFDIKRIYSQIDICVTITQYIVLCGSFVNSVAGYVNSHKKEKDYIVDSVKAYIKDNYAKDIYLDLLAEKLNITKTYLSSYFKNKTGVNLNDYINNYRIKKAIDIIENTSMRVQDIGLLVGFPNTNTFIRLFKKYTGKAPGEYRKMKI